jgi:hypothetical protein
MRSVLHATETDQGALSTPLLHAALTMLPATRGSAGCTQAEVDAGTLVIQPISAPQLREVTDLLTDVFEAGVDPIGLYTRWMRGQIRQYLEHHIKVACCRH